MATLLGANGDWAEAAAQQKKNVLFIAVDDLRPTLGCYGDKLVQSPNIDKLAAEGMAFTRTYCQQAVCSPSRNGVLTGLRPDTIGIYDLGTHFRTKLPDVVTLPQYFKENGYYTERMGKILHVGHGNHDDRRSWTKSPGPFAPPKEKMAAHSEDRWEEMTLASWWEEEQQANRQQSNRKTVPPTGAPDVPDNRLGDGKTADTAVASLERLAAEKTPFFLAVGFLKPHLPFVAPKKYWDLYDPAKFELEPVRDLPKNAPTYAGNGSGELRTYETVPQKGPIPDDMARQLIHGYYACVSYMDAQVGRVLDALDRLGLRENTVVVLWGDHGWHLGDHGLWCKHTNFERAAHAPLIVRAPGMANAGKTCSALTEFVDIYPTVCDFVGMPIPRGLEGMSVRPLTENPARPWKTAVFHQYPRNPQGKRGMGHSIRTDRYRLTEWTFPGNPDLTRIELYDYQTDPLEKENLAEKPESASLVAELRDRLHRGWQAEKPNM
ncbi:MAG: sulfatase [Armatimonadaceae bacterium]